jgi:hypothetical protein
MYVRMEKFSEVKGFNSENAAENLVGKFQN